MAIFQLFSLQKKTTKLGQEETEVGMGEVWLNFLKRGIICKRVKQFETAISESIRSEITISRKKWFCMGIYRPPNFDNPDTFFKEVRDSQVKWAWPTKISLLWVILISVSTLLE